MENTHHPDEPVRSSRIWYSGGGWDVPWYRWLTLGGDENCNRTLCLKLGNGALILALNVPLRQQPCIECVRFEKGAVR